MEFELEDIVFLKTDTEQIERMVTCKQIRPGVTIYYLACGTNETVHYACEISKEKDLIKKMTN